VARSLALSMKALTLSKRVLRSKQGLGDFESVALEGSYLVGESEAGVRAAEARERPAWVGVE